MEEGGSQSLPATEVGRRDEGREECEEEGRLEGRLNVG